MSVSGQRFGLHSWSDVTSLGSLILLGIGVIAWGLKLEARIDAQDRRIDTLEAQVGNGILPRAEERIHALERRMDRHEPDHE